MKKYNKPEIVALALETVDVIATSVIDELKKVEGMSNLNEANITTVEANIESLKTTWNW